MRTKETLLAKDETCYVVRFTRQLHVKGRKKTYNLKKKKVRYLCSEHTGWRRKDGDRLPVRKWSFHHGSRGWEEAHEFQSVKEAKLFCGAIKAVKRLQKAEGWTREIIMIEKRELVLGLIVDPVHPLIALAECAD